MRERLGGWVRKYRNLKLVNKMIAIYVMMLGFCFLLSAGALQYSFSIYDGKLYEKSLQELDFFTQQVNRSLDEVENLSYYIAIDNSIQEQLAKLKEIKLSAEYSYEVYRLRMLLSNEMNITNAITNIVYTDGGRTRFVVGMAAGKLDDGIYESMMERFHAAAGAYVAQAPTKDYPYQLSGRDIRKHIDSSMDYLGSLLITTDVARMIDRNIDALTAESSALCVFSNSGMIYENRENMMEVAARLEGDKGYRIVKDGGQRYFVCYLKSQKNGWTYVNMFPYTEIYGRIQNLRYMVFGGFFMLFLMTALILRKIAHRITKPLEQLTESMGIVETGDFEAAKRFVAPSDCTDEIGVLTEEFRVMLDKIDTLILDNYKKQILLKDTKYKLLQAQINPHFLYNTLNSINWMIRSGRNDEAAQMTVALGTILRAALSKEQYFTMKEELDSLRKYIVIQECRYRRRVEFHLDDQVGDQYLIPHMTLQPLVENAICHGVEKMLTPCAITVSVREEGEIIHIRVRDNGPGMMPEELEAVRNFTAKPQGYGIGLKNIYERLQLAFGQKMKFDITSVPGEGTEVEITIPKVETEEKHV